MSSQGSQRRARCAAQVIVDDPAQPELSDHDAHHLMKVRRLRDGEEIVASDGAGQWNICVLHRGKMKPITEVETELRLRTFAVAMAPVKGERSEWAVAKLTELGAATITALTTERAAVRWDDHQSLKVLDRWRRVSVEAACQSRNVFLPEITGPLSPRDFSGPNVAMGVLGGSSLTTAIDTILIGPEGGWSEMELGLGLEKVELAAGVLRAETAAVTAGALLGWLCSDTVLDNDHA